MKKLWNHICEVLLEDTVFDFQKKKRIVFWILQYTEVC